MECYLNVYDIHDSNQYLYSLGSGFYHTGVEINGYEYSFSNHGVAKTRPRLSEFGNLRDHLLMGVYSGSINELSQTIAMLRDGDFQQGTYNVTTKNCNHFSDALLMVLLNVHVPAWVNRMANIASNLPVGQSQNQETTETFAAPGKVREPAMPVKVEDKSQPTNEPGLLSSIFSWFGYGSSSVNSSNFQPVAPGQNPPPTAQKSSSNPTAKKELTEQQKKLLAKMKEKA